MIAMLLQAQGASPFGIGLLPIVAMLVFAYLVLFLPQQRRQKKWQAMLESLKTGDKVVTSGGLRGTVIALKDDALHLRVPPDNLRIEVTKASLISCPPSLSVGKLTPTRRAANRWRTDGSRRRHGDRHRPIRFCS